MKIPRAFFFLVALFLLTTFFGGGFAAASPGKAADLTAQCHFAATSANDMLDKAHDGKHATAWTEDGEEEEYLQISLPSGAQAKGLYIQWNTVPGKWDLHESSDGNGWNKVDLQNRDGCINAFVPLDGKAKKLRIERNGSGWKLSVAEIRLFGAGTIPSDVQVWQSPPEKADLMVIAAHPDDEFIYFGGTLPYYAGELKKRTVVVYMTSSPIIRKFEALNGLWKVGVKTYPVFLLLANKYTSTVEEAEADWGGLARTVSLLTEQMRRFRPDVVVTHDLNGEYGHGAHKLTALATEKAVDALNDPEKYSVSAKKYGVWKVKKCYLHLYTKRKTELDWNAPLKAFGGKTALDMAKAGYALHISQHFRDRPVEDSGPYDNAAFGLYYTSVGLDKKGGDFFENITPEEETSTADVTPEPQNIELDAQATMPGMGKDLPADHDLPALSGGTVPASSARGMTIALVAMLLAVAGMGAAASKKRLKNARHAKRKAKAP